MFTCNPLSVVVVTSEVVVDGWFDGAVVVQFTVQNEWKYTTLSWDGCGIVSYVKTTLQFTRFFVQ